MKPPGLRHTPSGIDQLDVSAGRAWPERDGFPDAREELAIQEAGFSLVAGLDEVGRGALAGPLVAGAVILPDLRDGIPPELLGVRDSKLLTPQQRADLYGVVLGCARAVGAGSVSPEELDLIGLTKAGELAMVRAVRALPTRADHLLIDAFWLKSCPLPQRPVIRGDLLCISVAAASIVAKVVRDRWMIQLDARYPEYGFASHKGYATPSHLEALERFGPSRLHRLTWAPMARQAEVATA